MSSTAFLWRLRTQLALLVVLALCAACSACSHAGHAHEHAHERFHEHTHEHHDHVHEHVDEKEEEDEEEEFSCGCCDHHEHEHTHNDGHDESRALVLAEPSTWGTILPALSRNALSACPWLLAGLVLTVLLQEAVEACFPPSAVRKYLTLRGGAAASSTFSGDMLRLCSVAALLGLATPLCSCGAIPLALALGAVGCAPAAVVSFLTAAQSAGLDSVAITFGILGWQTALFRLVGAFSLSVAAGAAVGHVSGRSSSAKQSTSLAEDVASPAQRSPKRNWSSRVRKVYVLLDETWFVLALGLLATTIAESLFGAADLVRVADSTDASGSAHHASSVAPLHSRSAWSDLVLRLTVILGGLPFQLCEHGVVSFARALQQSGASPGLAQAFLLCAPATNIGTLATVMRSTGNSPMAAIQSAVAICVVGLLLSYFVDSVFPERLSLIDDRHSLANSWVTLPSWWIHGSVYVVGAMLAWSVIRNRARNVKIFSFGLVAFAVGRWLHFEVE